MSKLAALRKKISQLEAQYAREAKIEMDAAVSKVKELMTSLGVTLEHLGLHAGPNGRKAAKPRKPSAFSPLAWKAPTWASWRKLRLERRCA